MNEWGLWLLVTLASVMPVALLAFLPWEMLMTSLILIFSWMTFSRVGLQTWSVAMVGVASIRARPGSSLIVVAGIAGVVGVLVTVLAMAQGFEMTLWRTGSDDTALIMREGAASEVDSVIDRESMGIIPQAQQVLKDSRGEPVASPEVVVIVGLPKKSGGPDVNVALRGVGTHAWELRPGVKIIAGRKFGLGLRELIAGKDVRDQFAGVALGSTLSLGGQSWTLVGIFDSGDAHNSELWGDAGVVGSAYRRGGNLTSVTVRLTDAAAFDAFKSTLISDPRLEVDVQTTRQYYSQQSEDLAHLIRVFGTTVGVIMGVGAVFGALNTMYSAVATRAREVATLRAIGFPGVSVIVAVLFETMLLAIAGGVIGTAIAWCCFDGFTASSLATNFSQVVFAFKVSPDLLWKGLKWALALGFIGGLLPAVSAARTPITTGLRAL